MPGHKWKVTEIMEEKDAATYQGMVEHAGHKKKKASGEIMGFD